MFPDKIFYEPGALGYALGGALKAKYADREWIPIESHNDIPALRQNENSAFAAMKRHLVVGVRKTHKYVENHKVSDYLVPFTSSGCAAKCLYCYLVCHYNKCSYLRLFVNREEMTARLVRTANNAERPLTFEIGSNSDLVLENQITGNLPWVFDRFREAKKGTLTFPTKFSMVGPLLSLDHGGRVIFRMSVNPREIIRKIELGTSPLEKRISALNAMREAGYPVGLLIAPVILSPDYESEYAELIAELADTLSEKVKRTGFIEIILMTYSYVHRAINAEAFPGAPELYDASRMTGRGAGRYCYRDAVRAEAEAFLRAEIEKKLKMPILYLS